MTFLGELVVYHGGIKTPGLHLRATCRESEKCFGAINNNDGVFLEPFNDSGGRGCHKFAPVLGGDGTKTAPPGDVFDQPPREMS